MFRKKIFVVKVIDNEMLFLRASALGAERVNGLWLSNAGVGAVNLPVPTICKYLQK